MELARTQLAAMAAQAGLRLSFSSERSVADELARESYADVSTVRPLLAQSLHVFVMLRSQFGVKALAHTLACLKRIKGIILRRCHRSVHQL